MGNACSAPTIRCKANAAFYIDPLHIRLHIGLCDVSSRILLPTHGVRRHEPVRAAFSLKNGWHNFNTFAVEHTWFALHMYSVNSHIHIVHPSHSHRCQSRAALCTSQGRKLKFNGSVMYGLRNQDFYHPGNWLAGMRLYGATNDIFPSTVQIACCCTWPFRLAYGNRRRSQ